MVRRAQGGSSAVDLQPMAFSEKVKDMRGSARMSCVAWVADQELKTQPAATRIYVYVILWSTYPAPKLTWNLEKGPCIDYYHSTGAYFRFPVSLGQGICYGFPIMVARA